MLDDKLLEVKNEIKKLPFNEISVALSNYAKVKHFIKGLEEWASEVSKMIQEEMESGGQNKIDILGDEGQKLAGFTIQERKKYTYPKEIEDLEEDLKKKKKIAELNGSATAQITKSLVYR